MGLKDKDIKIIGADKLLKKFKAIQDMDLKSAMTKATTLVQGQAIEFCPVDTGNLRESIHWRIEEDTDEIKGIVYTNNEYATYVEYGTGQVANGTYPDKTKVLTYSTKPYWRYQDKDGNWHTTSGHEANPFMYNSVLYHEQDIKDILEDGVKAVVRSRKDK